MVRWIQVQSTVLSSNPFALNVIESIIALAFVGSLGGAIVEVKTKSHILWFSRRESTNIRGLSGRFNNLFWKKERFWRLVVTSTIHILIVAVTIKRQIFLFSLLKDELFSLFWVVISENGKIIWIFVLTLTIIKVRPIRIKLSYVIKAASITLIFFFLSPSPSALPLFHGNST